MTIRSVRGVTIGFNERRVVMYRILTVSAQNANMTLRKEKLVWTEIHYVVRESNGGEGHRAVDASGSPHLPVTNRHWHTLTRDKKSLR